MWIRPRGKESTEVPLVAHFVNSLVTPSLSCVHKPLLSFDWGRRPCQSKYLDSVSVCLCVLVPFVISSIPGKSSLLLSFIYLDITTNFKLFVIFLKIRICEYIANHILLQELQKLGEEVENTYLDREERSDDVYSCLLILRWRSSPLFW